MRNFDICLILLHCEDDRKKNLLQLNLGLLTLRGSSSECLTAAHINGCEQDWPPCQICIPILDHVPKQFLRFLTEQLKGTFVVWCKVTIKILRFSGKMV